MSENIPVKKRGGEDGKQIVLGVAISYILIAFNAIYGLVITPYLVRKLGAGDYGVYKTIASLSSSLMVIDLGLGNTVQRYVAKYVVDREDKKKIGNFISMTFIEASILAFVACIICLYVYFNLGAIYSKGLTAAEITLAKEIFIVLALTVVAHLYENVLNGVITGYNRFIVANGIKLLRLILRLVFTYVGLIVWRSPMLLVALDFSLILVMILCEFLYIRFILKQKVKFTHFEPTVFRESLVYSVFMLISSLVNQVNSNLGNIVVGAFLGSVEVTIYSTALTIFNMFSQIGSSVSSVMLPRVTGLLKCENVNIEDYVVKIGRIQFMLVGAAFGAFTVLGKSFISIWMGDGFADAYLITIILMIPAVFEICINVCLAVLRATNKLKFRTVVLVLMLLFNAVVTIVGVPRWGYFAAALGTMLSYTIGEIIAMNCYYHKKLGMHPCKVYCKIFSRTWLCIILSSAAAYFTTLCFSSDLKKFILGALMFIFVYAILLFLTMKNNIKTEEQNNRGK